ncbi:MAG: 6-phosphogluconolactonase [Cyanobacteria bacterium P01_H01_bin.15]
MPAQEFYIDRLQVSVYEEPTSLAIAAAYRADEIVQSAITKRGEARVILATGNSQLEFLRYLAKGRTVDWSQVTIFHLDEFLGVDAQHPASFRHYLRERAEKPLQPQAFHYLIGDTAEPVAECERYEALLRQKPIDLCCLGIGRNGHLAFNEPAIANFTDPHLVKLVKIDACTRAAQVGAGQFSGIEEVPKYAFTLTLSAIAQAENLLCLAFGQSKKETLEKLARERISSVYPATLLRRHSQSQLFTDLREPLRCSVD